MSLSNVLHPKHSRSISMSRQEILLPGQKIILYSSFENKCLCTISVVGSQQRREELMREKKVSNLTGILLF